MSEAATRTRGRALVEDMPLDRRLAGALLSAGLVLLTIVALSGGVLVAVRSSQDRVVDDFYTAIRFSHEVQLGLVDTETAVRGYALTHDPTILEPMARADRPWSQAAVAPILRRLHDEPSATRLLMEAQRRAQAWYDAWASPSVARIGSGATLTRADIDRGREMFDAVRSAFDRYLEELRTLRTSAQQRLKLLTSLLFAGVVLSALAAAATAIALWLLLRRWVSRPVAQLAEETRLVSDGTLDHPVRVDGPPEFRSLAADVDTMRQRLVSHIDELTAARDRVTQAHEQLATQASELQRSNRDLEQFAYVASHDLQEPLRKVASFCQLLQRRYAGQLDDRADQYIAFAVDGAKRMQQLINDLLAFSRVGRVTAPVTQVPLEECLDVALGNLSAVREETGAEVTHDPLPTVPGEAGLLTQLLQNLVGNAVKFRGEEPPRIHLGVQQRGECWEFCCSDNGIGIEPEYADRVFVIFQRLHGRDAYEGTGIGLALCKKIVEYHGGAIWIDPDVAVGTTVRWTLPSAEGAGPCGDADAVDEGAGPDARGQGQEAEAAEAVASMTARETR